MKLDIRFDQDAVDGLILLVHSYYYRIIEIISDRSSVRNENITNEIIAFDNNQIDDFLKEFHQI